MIIMDGVKTQLLNVAENSGRFTPFYTAICGQEQPTVGIISPKAVVMKTSILEPFLCRITAGFSGGGQPLGEAPVNITQVIFTPLCLWSP